MKTFILIVFVAIIVSSCTKEPVPYTPTIDFQNNKKAVELISADNDFAFYFFREVHKLAEEENYMVSPLSVAIALGMTYNGAETDTKTAFEETLRLKGFSRHEINILHSALINHLLRVDPKVQVEIANSIWVNDNFSLKPTFADTNIYYYKAGINTLDFSNPDSKNIINSWISHKTHDKIKDVIDAIPPDALMYLINAIYFNGNWKYEFEKSDNSPITFKTEDGKAEEVEGMKLTATLNTSYQNDLSLLELPYGNDRYSMVIMLPSEEKNVEEIIQIFSAENWSKWMNEMKETNITVHIPKFKHEYKTLLNKHLTNMGLGIAFGNADFSGMINEDIGLNVSRVIHQTFIDVNEKGTEAAAVTVVEMRYTSAGPGEGATFLVDRPFLYLIREKSSGAIVFMGKVGNPKISG